VYQCRNPPPADPAASLAATTGVLLPQRSGPTAYPATVHYITDEQLRSTMWQLAYHSRELGVLMASPEEIAVNRAKVLQHLQAMEQVTNDLNRTGWPSNHPLVDANRSSFLQDIRTAQDGVSRDPPNFFLAGVVSGAGAYCQEAGEQRRYHGRAFGPKLLSPETHDARPF
jgi:hypothetical protein